MNDGLVKTSLTDADDSAANSILELVLWFLVPGLVVGYVLYLVALDFPVLPIKLQLPLFWFLIVAPLAHFLITTRAHRVAGLMMAVALAVVCSLLHFWYGMQLQVHELPRIPESYITISMLCTIAIAAATLPFYRTILHGKPFNDYPSLFRFSWNQVVSALVAFLFTLAVFGIMGLSTALFDLIGIDIDRWIWRTDVRYVVGAGSFALGIGICRTRDGIVNGVRYLLVSLLRALLPIFVFITGAFVIATGVQGLDGITGKLSVTAVLLGSTVVALTLCTAGVGETKTIESRWISVLCRVLVLLMAVLCVLAVWAMWQRVSQHGLTGARVWAIILLTIASAYTLGYVVAAVTPRLSSVIQQTNVIMVLVCGLVAILLQTPALSVQSIAANNQLSRFKNGAGRF